VSSSGEKRLPREGWIRRARSVDLDELSDGTDWERVEALSDDEIRRAMANDPDAALELDEAF